MKKSNAKRQTAAKAVTRAAQGAADVGEEKMTGAYVAASSTMMSTNPRIVKTSTGYIVEHRELVATIAGSVGFAANFYPVNPGLVTTFPWLSTLAQSYEQYRFNALQFEFITRAATADRGSVLMVPEYDPTDPAPLSEAAASASVGCVEGSVWKNLACRFNPASMFPLGPRKFTRACRTAGDLRTFDSGSFSLCTVGEANTDDIGKLWVHYKVELFVPQSALATQVGTGTSAFGRVNPQACATGVPEAAELDVSYVDALRIGAATAGVWTPPAGAYLITASVLSVDTAAEDFMTWVAIQKNGTSVTQNTMNAPGIAGASHVVPIQAYVTCNGTDTVQLQVNLTGAAGALTLARFFISFVLA